MSSLTEVAKRAGVSVTTASLVLNPGKQVSRISDACAKRVRAIADELGYVPNYHAQVMKLGRAEAVAVVMDYGHFGPEPFRWSILKDPYYSALVGGMDVEARNHDSLLTLLGPEAKRRAPERGWLGMRQRRFDGMIICGRSLVGHETGFLQRYHRKPIVAVDYPGQTTYPAVAWNEQRSVELALEHLRQLGHRQILWLGPDDPQGTQPKMQREHWFRESIAQADVRGSFCRYDHDAIHRYQEAQHYTWETDLAADTLSDFLGADNDGFTAVLAYNDAAALGACRAVYGAGKRIPEDVSVMGIDNLHGARNVVPLTSVSHEIETMGRRATRMLFEMVEDAEAIKRYHKQTVLVEPKLVVRQSTAAPPR
jgi:LacI family transcriptional regulator